MNFVLKSYFHSETFVSFKNLIFIQKHLFHSKTLLSFKNLIFIQKSYFYEKPCVHSITSHSVYAEITGQLNDRMISRRKLPE